MCPSLLFNLLVYLVIFLSHRNVSFKRVIPNILQKMKIHPAFGFRREQSNISAGIFICIQTLNKMFSNNNNKKVVFCKSKGSVWNYPGIKILNWSLSFCLLIYWIPQLHETELTHSSSPFLCIWLFWSMSIFAFSRGFSSFFSQFWPSSW